MAERLLIKVSEEIERLYTHVRALDSSLQERPEVLHSARMDVPFHVRLGVVDYVVGVVGAQSVIGQMFIRHQVRPFGGVTGEVRLQLGLLPIRHKNGANLPSFRFGEPEYDSLAEV